jgi:predicted DNA-binding transcriptional regulator AlpA
MKKPSWLSMKEVLEDLGVPRSTMNDWRARGQGPRFVKLPGGQLRLSRVEYEAWCADLQEAAA